MKFNMRIYIIGEPILREKAREVKEVSAEERIFFDEMVLMMRQSKGVGLAANQVGVGKQMCVLEFDGKVLKLANPKIIKKKGSDILEEGCLSLPEVMVKVERVKEIRVLALNENNEKIDFIACDILARIIQHEVDHLLGKLIIDYAPLWQKLALRKKIKELKKLR